MTAQLKRRQISAVLTQRRELHYGPFRLRYLFTTILREHQPPGFRSQHGVVPRKFLNFDD